MKTCNQHAPDALIQDVCRRQRCCEEMLSMPVEMRRVFMLRNGDGLTAIETSQATGLSPEICFALFRATMQPMRIIAGTAVTGELNA